MKHLPVIFSMLIYTVPLLASSDVRVAGHRYAARVEHKNLEWSLRGAEHFRFRLFSVFTGALYGLPDSEARKLTFTYTRKIDRNTLVEQGIRVLREAHPADKIKSFQEQLDAINKAYVDVKAGDRYTITVIPGRGTWLQLNDDEKFFVGDDEFGLWYLSIWLGEKPMSISFRDALLNGNP